jgi:hypothetical protein
MASRYDIIRESLDLLKMDFNEGDRIELNGKLNFGQDMAFWQGTFEKDVFTVGKRVGCWINLTAPGYGIPGNYGNGAIFVLPKELEKVAKKL